MSLIELIFLGKSIPPFVYISLHIYLDEKSYNRILLIDDFVWSGATLNITAKKLKSMWIANSIIGLAIVGNLDMNYEVINEI